MANRHFINKGNVHLMTLQLLILPKGVPLMVSYYGIWHLIQLCDKTFYIEYLLLYRAVKKEFYQSHYPSSEQRDVISLSA